MPRALERDAAKYFNQT